MIDFDAVRHRIHDEGDLVLFDEAVTCHNGGAYRAAYVFAWIAAAEGLLNKLDTMGGAQADIGAFVAKFKAEQEAGSGKDATLLDQAAKVGLVDATEYKALNSLRELRNQYGHPTAAAPSATAAAAAIELAADAVLAKPALLQHGGARQLAERIGADAHYIPDDAAAIAGWTVARAPLIADTARPVFIRTLVEQHAANLGQIDEALSERCRLVAATSLVEWGSDLAEGRWAVDALQQAHGPSAAAIFGSAGVWDLLGEDDQYRVLSRSLEIPTMAADPKLTNRLLARAFELHAGGTLNELQLKLVADRVQAIDGSWLIGAGAPVDLLLDKAAGYLNDGSFDENKKGTRVLDAIPKSLLTAAGDAALAGAGAALTRAARQNAFVAVNLLDEVVRKPDDWPQAFRIALAVEGALGPWLFQDEYTARQAMVLSLHDEEVAKAVQAAVLQPTKQKHVGFKAAEVIQGIEGRIDVPDDKVDASAIPLVREILDVVADRYRDVYGDDT